MNNVSQDGQGVNTCLVDLLVAAARGQEALTAAVAGRFLALQAELTTGIFALSTAEAQPLAATSLMDELLKVADRSVKDEPSNAPSILALRGGLEHVYDGLVEGKLLTREEIEGDMRELEALSTWSSFAPAALPWVRMGRPVIPGGGGEKGKSPLVKFTAISGAERRRQLVREVVAFAQRHPTAPCLLLMAGGPQDQPDLVVVDVDDIRLLPWVIETFGDTALKVKSGREGGGIHLYYARQPGSPPVVGRNGAVGPAEAFRWNGLTLDGSTGEVKRGHWGTTALDVKAGRAYVVGPGSLHKSGATYTSSEPITAELIASLPEFDTALYERLVTEGVRLRNEHTPGRGLTSRQSARNEKATAGSTPKGRKKPMGLDARIMAALDFALPELPPEPEPDPTDAFTDSTPLASSSAESRGDDDDYS